MTDEPFRPLIRTQAELEECWRYLLRPLGFRSESLWLLPIGDDDRPLTRLIEIAEATDIGPADVPALTVLLETVRDETDLDRIALLRSRPGAGGVSPDDRVVARALYDAAVACGLGGEVVHVATDADIHPVPLDDLPVAV